MDNINRNFIYSNYNKTEKTFEETGDVSFVATKCISTDNKNSNFNDDYGNVNSTVNNSFQKIQIAHSLNL